MSQTTYEYQFLVVVHQEKFLEAINKLGQDGWHVVSYSTTGRTFTALLERSRAIKVPHKTPSS